MISAIKSLLLAACAAIPMATGTATAQSDSETFRVSNESSFRIDNVYMTRTSNQRWGYDRLSGYLFPRQYLDLSVDPGRYDVKLIDKDGDACIVKKVDVFEGTVFHVTNVVLLSCEWVSR